MAKTWENYECEFFTGNSENAQGDSKYLVLTSGMNRTALVNFKRAPNQVLSSNPSIAYLDPKGLLCKVIMETPHDEDITIASAEGDRIFVMVNRGPIEPYLGECSRKPENGLCTFDFDNENGVLTHIHVGHVVKLLQMGRPRRKSI
jgi:hypothetical protein